jgi:hypothetical protein
MQAPTTLPQQLPHFTARGVAAVLVIVAIAAVAVVLAVRLTGSDSASPAASVSARTYTAPEASFSVYVVATDAERFALLDMLDALTVAVTPWERTNATREIVVVGSDEPVAELSAALLELNAIRTSMGLEEVRVYDLR